MHRKYRTYNYRIQDDVHASVEMIKRAEQAVLECFSPRFTPSIRGQELCNNVKVLKSAALPTKNDMKRATFDTHVTKNTFKCI